jgi:Zn-dependent protease with chaperone function
MELRIKIRRLRSRIQFVGLLMYGLAVASEVPVIITRIVVVFIASIIVTTATGHHETFFWSELTLLLTGWSALAFITPAGTGWWWKQRIGGRKPSEREQNAYQDAVELLQAHSAEPLHLPGSWFVLDVQEPDAGACGNTLMLSRGLLEMEDLPAVIAHELGHIATLDGRLTAALNRLVFLPPHEPEDPQERREQREHKNLRREHRRLRRKEKQTGDPADPVIEAAWLAAEISWKAISFARGGIGLRIVGPIIAFYWRRREYKADQYAAGLGQADELADFLEIHALMHDHPVPTIWLTEHTHPPTELRLQRLRNYVHEPLATA